MSMQGVILVKVNFEGKVLSVFPFEKCLFLVLTRNTIMLQHLIYPFFIPLSVKWSLRGVKNKGKFQTFSSKSGHGHLGEVAAYKRFQIK